MLGSGGVYTMSEGHSVKIDRRAFNRGFDDILTLRPLREAVESVISSKSGTSEGRGLRTITAGTGRDGGERAGTRTPTRK